MGAQPSRVPKLLQEQLQKSVEKEDGKNTNIDLLLTAIKKKKIMYEASLLQTV